MALTAAVFVFGPMARPALLAVVLGQGWRDLVQAAHLPGYGAGLEVPGLVQPGLTPDPGAHVDGWLLRAPDAAARLACVAGALLKAGLGGPVSVQTRRGAESAQALDGPPGAMRWQPDQWSARSDAILAEAARECMEDLDAGRARGLAARRAMILARAWARVAAARASMPTALRSTTPARRVQVRNIETPHAGFFRTRVYSLRHPRFDGGTSPELRREIFVATDAALVLPYDPARDRVLLVEQFRMGPFGRGDPRPWLLEPVAGRIDGGETPEDTARRECMEEAGLALRQLEKISSHYCTPGYSTELFHLFLGLCDLPGTASGRGGLATENEDIRTHVIGFDRAMDLVHSGEANNGPLVLGLVWLQRERARLRAAA